MSDKQGSSSTDTMIVLIFVLALLIGAMLLVEKFYWIFNAFYGAIAWVYVFPVAKLVQLIPVLNDIPILGPLFFRPCYEANNFLASGNFSEMTFKGGDSARKYVMSAAGRVAFLIYGPFLLRAAFTETQVHVDQFYRKRHTLESMIREQAKSFPTIRMFRNNNPIENRDLMPKDFAAAALKQIKSGGGPVGNLISGNKVMIRASGFTRSINPEEWLVSNGLVFDQKAYEDLTSGLFPADDRQFYFEREWEKLTIPSISEVLEDQLARPWKGARNLPIHLKALFAVMVNFYAYEREDGNAMLDKLALLADKAIMTKKPIPDVLEGDKDLIQKIEAAIDSKAGKQMEFLASQHAWVESALPTILHLARFERGVLASASFIWLKSVDRAAWYILNATGNNAVNVEAAGAMAHNRAELDFKSPLIVPHVYQAARSILHDYLDCKPERVEMRRRLREERRGMDEQVHLMSAEAKERMETLERMNIEYVKDEDDGK